jgi:2,3-bisphosphoglycerate-independent phosphoglycerate mutase
VWQDSLIIDQAIGDGAFFENETLLDVMRHAKENNTRLHLMGLISNGSVHSSETHYFALLEMAAREGLRADQVLVHAFTDGRDTAPRSARLYIGRLLEQMVRTGIGSVASVIGRYYAMDRDNRWERVQTAYDCLTQGKGFIARDAIDAVEQAYARDENDEFIKATVVLDTDGNPRPRIADNDAVLFFNYRSDRGRQLAQVFIDPEFDAHLREESQQPGAAESDHPPTVTKFLREVIPSTYFATMTRYAATLQCPIGFEPRPQRDGLGETVAKAGKTQLRIAETEKYPHVTYFFSGGMEIPWDGEERILVNSPKVATYDLQPQMSAPEVTEKVTAAIRSKQFDCIVLNYANPDMVGHTGIVEAAVAAVEEIDRGLGQVMQAIDEVGGALLVIADHGNCEQMLDYETGEPHTAHTTNPVPCILYSKGFENAKLRSGGRLADVSPTLLGLMQIEQPPAMTGVNLLQASEEQLVEVHAAEVSTERELMDAIAQAIASKQEIHRFYRMAGVARETALQSLYARFADDASTHAKSWQEQNPLLAATPHSDETRAPNTSLSDMEIVDATLQAERGLATHWQQLQDAAQLEETQALFGELAREATSHIELIQKVTGTQVTGTVTTGNEKE